MKKVTLVFAIALACSTTAMAADIAFYVGTPNFDGWYTADAQTADVATIIAQSGHLFQDIQQFDDSQFDEFGAWVDANTDDGEMDILWLNGCMPSVLYPYPNVEPDGSRVEEWLDGGNMIINVGDWFGYVSYEGGARQTENGTTGAANILDLAAGIIVSADNTELTVTPAGAQYLPSLSNPVITYRPIALSAIVAPWEVAASFASSDGTEAGPQADPIVIHNTDTDAYVAFVNQSAGSGPPGWLDDRGLTCAEFINNWVNEVIGLGLQPLAGGPKPKNGSMISQTTAMLEWYPGAFASVHDVYFGQSYEAVEAATRDDAGVFLGTLSSTKVRVGVAGDPYGTPLVPGQTYYWRVDEVNDVNPESPWKGNVWSFMIEPVTAYNPAPADGVPYVPLNPELTWTAGMGTLFHTVFFGESYDAVDAMMVGWMVADEKVTPASAQLYGPLQPGTTYYWRVDEFAMTGVTSRGEIWSFTTVPDIPVADPALVGWWTLDEGMGTNAVDWSGHGYHGKLLGDTQWTDGYHGPALQFDGSGDYVDMGNPSDWPAGTAARSMCGWAKTDTLSAGWHWIAAYGSPSTSRAMFIGSNGASLYGGGYGDDVFVDGFWQIGVWHHICLTYDGTTAILYADGQELVSEAKTWNLARSRAHIGRQVNTAAEFWKGTLDDVRVYSKALTPAEIAEIMRGNPLVAASPNPAVGAVVDIRDATMLSWSAGDTAASHNVYFGTDRAALELQGNQAGTSFSLAGLVELGGGDYFWRIDEVEAGGTVQTGYTWRFTIPDYLIVDDFESYTNDVGSRVFEKWIDGVGFTQPVDTPGNGTGALVGHDIWTPGTTYTTIVETGNVAGGNQAMPIYYDNTFSPFRSEVDRTFTPGQNWTAEGVTTLVVHLRGDADNTGDLYVKINGVKVPYNGDPADITSRRWITWEIDLASVGTNLSNVSTLTIGVEGGQTGVLYIDEVILTKP